MPSTCAGSTRPSKGQPKAALRVMETRTPSSRARSVSFSASAVASATVVFWLRCAKVSVTGKAVYGRHHLLGARHLRHPPGVDEARGLDPGHPGGGQPVAELGADLGGERSVLVLEAVAGSDVHYLHAHQTMPRSRRPAKSSSLIPSISVKTSSLCCPSFGPVQRTLPGVSERRGKTFCIGNGPISGSSTSTTFPRAAYCSSSSMSLAVNSFPAGTLASLMTSSTSSAFRSLVQPEIIASSSSWFSPRAWWVA